MPLIDTDGWWRKHAVTAQATIVEVGLPTQMGDGGGIVNQKITADVTDPDTGRVVRAKSQLMSSGGLRVGDTVRVRCSAKREYFREYNSYTVPKEEWLKDANTPLPSIQIGGSDLESGLPSVQVINASGADPATVIEKLAKLRAQGLISDGQLAQVQQQLGEPGSGLSMAPPESAEATAGGSVDSTEGRLETLERLRADGVLNQEEYAKQRQRILDSL